MDSRNQSNQFLEKIVSAQNPSHAYLFFGPPGSAKESEARSFAKALLCSNPKIKPCGECRACQKFQAGNHPDFREVGTEGDKIKIAETRELKEESRFAPLEGKWKIVLIPEAERLTEEAAQSTLKLLEEPPVRMVIVLTATHPSRLLPTIASRCQRIPFGVKRVEDLANDFVLQGLTQEMALLLARLESPLSEGQAWSLLVTEAAPILFSETRGALDLFEKVSALEDHKEQAEQLLHLLYAFYRDVAVVKAGWEEGPIFSKFKDRIEPLSRAISWPALWEKSQAILQARNHLSHSGNFRLVLENLFWKLKD